jgi:hypothetical protein
MLARVPEALAVRQEHPQRHALGSAGETGELDPVRVIRIVPHPTKRQAQGAVEARLVAQRWKRLSNGFFDHSSVGGAEKVQGNLVNRQSGGVTISIVSVFAGAEKAPEQRPVLFVCRQDFFQVGLVRPSRLVQAVCLGGATRHVELSSVVGGEGERISTMPKRTFPDGV